LNIANGRISSNNISIIGNGVDIDAAGSMAIAGQGNLDYNGNAHITAEKNALTNVLAGLSGASFDNGKLSFPFGLGGSFSEPRFTLKSLAGPGGKLGAVQGALGAASGKQPAQAGQQQNPAELVQGIAGLVKKKKATPAQQPATQPNK
jgi:hypothetical protein